jgi:hypothetical protein
LQGGIEKLRQIHFELISVDDKNTNPGKMEILRNIEYCSKQKPITARQPMKRPKLRKFRKKKIIPITSEIRFTKRTIERQPPTDKIIGSHFKPGQTKANGRNEGNERKREPMLARPAVSCAE